MTYYVCKADSFTIGGFPPLKKGEKLSKSLVFELRRGRITVASGEKLSKLSFYIGQGVIARIDEKEENESN